MTTFLPKIAFPEGDNSIIKEAAAYLKHNHMCDPVLGDGSIEALENHLAMLKDHDVDGVIAGIDMTSRDVILAARNIVGMREDTSTFTSLFLIETQDQKYILSDAATCRNPSVEQLVDIILLVNEAANKILYPELAKIAMLSFSTNGSGGNKDESIIKIRDAIKIARDKNPNIQIDGEMQLDAAINPRIAVKKMPNSNVAGSANTLICPDINSANILYKGLEQIAGAKAYGPILLGFNEPISDLSRGSTVDDVLGTAQTLINLINS